MQHSGRPHFRTPGRHRLLTANNLFALEGTADTALPQDDCLAQLDALCTMFGAPNPIQPTEGVDVLTRAQLAQIVMDFNEAE